MPYPWRCLCRGFSQITRTTPFRRMTLHLEQMTLTEDRTFMFYASSRTSPLLETIRNPASRQIVGRELNGHLVPRQDLDKMHPHLP